MNTLRLALERTAAKRGSSHILNDYPEIMRMIRESTSLRNHWEKYRKEFEYAKEITFDDACNSIDSIMNLIK
jgi:hypothetical protein